MIHLRFTGKARQRNLALIFVTMIAGDQKDGRTLAILDAHERDRYPAISGKVRRMGQSEAVRLLAVGVIVDWCPHPRLFKDLSRMGHCRIFSRNSRVLACAGASKKVAGAETSTTLPRSMNTIVSAMA